MIQNQLDKNSYNEALSAYEKVISLINSRPDYPKGFVITEKAEQHELEAHYHVVYIPYAKALYGMKGSHNSHLLLPTSTYKETRDLKTYPQYKSDTLKSLRETIEKTNACLNLPRKNYHRPLLYHQTMAYCRMMKDYAQQLQNLERERLKFLENPACANDIEVCREYQDVVFNKIFPLKETKELEEDKIWEAKSIAAIPDYR